VILHANLDVHDDGPEVVDNSKSDVMDDNISTPMHSLRESESSPPWTEVVRRGKNRNRSNNISKNERCTLEYYKPV
jgi:hypothetical protein